MSIIYNLIVQFTVLVLNILALFNTKLSLFVKGRKQTSTILNSKITKEDKTIWIHAASLGEYEQGLPIMENIKKEYPNHKLVLTFFSPSGYEVKKNANTADVITYLPLDTKARVNSFLDKTHPDLAIFIKYEIWPNYLKELKNRNIPTLLISALFKKEQAFFKWYGGFMRKALHNLSFIFVQNKSSLELLKEINVTNTAVAGDTRFDRVLKITKGNNTLEFMNNFIQKEFCFVAGSTWPQDEKLLVDYINQSNNKIKYVIAPHNIKPKHIEALRQSIHKPTLLYTEIENGDVKNAEVLIINTIGILTKIYSYANIAYVGGGFATGLHNTLEPAVFGVPVIIGPKFNGFAEAENLVKLGGALSVTNKNEFSNLLNKMYNEDSYRISTGKINKDFIEENKGASLSITKKVLSLLK